MNRHLIPCFCLYGRAEEEKEALEQALSYQESGADALLLLDESEDDAGHEAALSAIRGICENTGLPVYAAGHIRRFEDIKKALYAGCHKVVVSIKDDSGVDLLREGARRFGKESLIAGCSDAQVFASHKETILECAGLILDRGGITGAVRALSDIPVILWPEEKEFSDIVRLLGQPHVYGLTGSYVSDPSLSLYAVKETLKENGISAETHESPVPWADIKKNADGLLPVVTQDVRTGDVLMVAYMNEEAFQTTIRTGRMTYFSRSRQSLWVKGETSGHYQYVKSLTLDCDNDTLLAKVSQVGAACHTGNRTCFFQPPLYERETKDANPLAVFQQVYDVIMDRQKNPREGSYTNYLFDKGIDKILKKVGEECTEIVIAAKNPDPQETVYEISDFMYHLMVLMALKGISWEDVTNELSRRE